MNIPVRIGMDTSKSVFQLHGVDENEVVVVRRQFRRAEMIRYFERLPPVLVAMESCGSSHHWGRLLQSFGHEVKLIPPQYVKAYPSARQSDCTQSPYRRRAAEAISMYFLGECAPESRTGAALSAHRTGLSLPSLQNGSFPNSSQRFCANLALLPATRERRDRVMNRKSPPLAGLFATIGGGSFIRQTAWLATQC
jgi:transposase